jgi:hypothetical protein
MVCRSTPGNSSSTTIARSGTNLHDVQVLSLFHQIRSEPAALLAEAPSRIEQSAFVDGLIARADELNFRGNQGIRLRERLELARTQNVDGRTYYAWQRIEERAQLARLAMDTHFTEIASRFDTTTEETEAAFNAMMHRDYRVNGSRPLAPDHVPFATTHLPHDRGTRHALAMLYFSGPSIATSSQRLMASVQAAVLDDSTDIGRAMAEDAANQCADCGQFASEAHTCPTEATETAPPVAQPSEATNTDPVAVPTPAPTLRPTLAQARASAFDSVRQDPNSPGYIGRGGARYPNLREAVAAEAALNMEADTHDYLTGVMGSADFVRFNFTAVALHDSAEGTWSTPDGVSHPNRGAALLHTYEQGLNPLFPPAETEAGSPVTNCDTCGQFAGTDHACDPRLLAELGPGSAEEGDGPSTTSGSTAPASGDPLEAWHTELVEENAAGSPLAPWEVELLTGLPHEDVAAAPSAPSAPRGRRVPAGAFSSTTPSTTPTPPTRRRNPARNYQSGDSTINMMNVSAVRAACAGPEAGTFTLDNVRVTLRNANGETGPTLTGSLGVTNNGQRRTRTRDRYTVTETEARSLRCTCPDYRETYDCVHLRQARENVQALLNQRDAVATAPQVAMNTVNADLREEYDQSVAASLAARAGYDATANVSYSESMAPFQSAWDEAKAHFEAGETALPYMYENATNGLGAREGGRSIGIEIEVDFPDDMHYTAKQRVARDIYAAGLSDSGQVRPWHWRARQVGHRGQPMGGGYTDNPNMWSVEADSSVDDVGGQRGCEIVSPILYDTPETWRNLKTICDIVERHGGRVTPRTGLHINIGAADFDHTVGNHNRLIGLANSYEDVIVRTAHNPQSGREHRGRDYCRPMSMPAEGFSSISQAQRSIDPQNRGSSHRAMINLDHVPAEGAPVRNSTRVEVRIFDGSVDPGRIQANVKLSLGLVNAAVRGVQPPSNPEPAGTHRASNVGSNGRMRRLRGEEWEADTRSFRELADTIFTRDEDKKQLTYAFAASRWQRR